MVPLAVVVPHILRDRPSHFDTFKQIVSDAGPVLQKRFGIQADPFPECTMTGLCAALQAFPDLPSEPHVGEDKRGHAEDE